MIRSKDFYKEIEDELDAIESGATMEDVNAADASVQQSLTMQRGRIQVKITRLETELKKAQEEMARLDKSIATKKVGTGIQ
jgi:hypothetical protein